MGGKWYLNVSVYVIKDGSNSKVITYDESGTYWAMNSLFDNKIWNNKTKSLNF